MRSFLKKAPLAKLGRVYGPLVGSFVIGVLLRGCYHSEWIWAEQFHALGDALMVAGIIGCCIELWATSVLIDHATEELSSRLVGYGLPKAAQGLIRNLS
jgi:hypothetical protein